MITLYKLGITGCALCVDVCRAFRLHGSGQHIVLVLTIKCKGISNQRKAHLDSPANTPCDYLHPNIASGGSCAMLL